MRRAEAHRLFTLEKHALLVTVRAGGGGERIQHAIKVEQKNRHRVIHGSTLWKSPRAERTV